MRFLFFDISLLICVNYSLSHFQEFVINLGVYVCCLKMIIVESLKMEANILRFRATRA